MAYVHTSVKPPESMRTDDPRSTVITFDLPIARFGQVLPESMREISNWDEVIKCAGNMWIAHVSGPIIPDNITPFYVTRELNDWLNSLLLTFERLLKMANVLDNEQHFPRLWKSSQVELVRIETSEGVEFGFRCGTDLRLYAHPLFTEIMCSKIEEIDQMQRVNPVPDEES